MKLDEINKILYRINRLIEQISNKEMLPFEWSYTFPDGQECTYYFKKIKNPDEIEDNFTSAFVWLWSLKDYYKSLAKYKGANPNIVEEMINQDEYFPLCGDIANMLKHSCLRKSRSKYKPSLGSVAILGSSEKNSFKKKLLFMQIVWNLKWVIIHPLNIQYRLLMRQQMKTLMMLSIY